MARPTFDHDASTLDSSSVAMPVEELRGRTVWTDSGDEVGKLREFRTDADGRITALEVQHGWMRGQRYVVDADSMRIEEGSVVVPASAVERIPAKSKSRRSRPTHASMGTATAAPALIEGRAGAKRRFGGLSPSAGIVGALTALASMILIGGLMSAIFTEVNTVQFDESFSSSSDLWSNAMLGGAVTLALSMLIGGWAAGRVARFNGITNGLSVTGWIILIGAACAALGAWIGDSANVFNTADLPNVAWSDVTGWAIVGMAVALAIMLVFSMIGGALGALYNRAVDKTMLRPARMGSGEVVDSVDHVDHTDRVDHTGDTVVSRSVIADDTTARRDVGVVGTPAGTPVTPRPMGTTDSARDVRRPD